MNNQIAQARNELEDFLKSWPVERVRRMTLEEYTNNERKDAFAYWVEFKTRNIISIGGGSALKYGIYKRNNISKEIKEPSFLTDGEYLWYKKFGPNRQEAFEKVKGMIIQIIDSVKSGALKAIDDIEMWDTYKWKIAVLYSDGKLAQVVKREALIDICNKLHFAATNATPISEMQEFLISQKAPNIDAYEYGRQLWGLYNPGNETGTSGVPEAFPPKKEEKFPLNTILYGPPGTGKTYHTKSLAIKIIENLSDQEFVTLYPRRELVSRKYKEYMEKGQIGFITFHQSFSYEDFIEGIKPRIIDESEDEATPGNEGRVDYEIKKGVFREICDQASSYKESTPEKDISFTSEFVESLDRVNYFKVSLGNTAKREDDIIYQYCVDNNCIAVGFFDNIDLTAVNSPAMLKMLAEQNQLGNYEFTAIKCLKFLMKAGDIVFVSNGNLSVRAIGILTDEYSYTEKIPYNQIRKVKWILRDISIPVNEIYGRRFSQQTVYQMYNSLIKKEYFRDKLSKTTNEQDEKNKLNHVLIIDEINRGNIANIFGELITLIEEDKRSGMEEEISAILPYSKAVFSVPSNLYIIGTMNTADRSIEALDTALRRRFTFLPVYPEPEELSRPEFECQEVNLEDMLTAINARIEILLDRDHCIGHSYFMGIKNKENPIGELKEIFRNKIIPLLQEYFYGDTGKIGFILGGTFVTKKNDGPQNGIFLKNFNGNIDSQYDDKIIYEISDPQQWDFEDIYA